MNFKNKLIKALGGYTATEYTALDKKRIRAEQKYQALLDSKSNSANVAIANEYIGRVLLELRRYAKHVLYPLSGDEWARRMFHVIENNLLRLTFRYKESESSMPYILDTTLDSKDEFLSIIKYEKPYDEIEYIVNSVVETD